MCDTATVITVFKNAEKHKHVARSAVVILHTHLTFRLSALFVFFTVSEYRYIGRGSFRSLELKVRNKNQSQLYCPFCNTMQRI